MRPHERTFAQWREIYFDSLDDQVKDEALDNMLLIASFKDEWSELFRIATEEENLSPGHAFAAICSNGIFMAPPRPPDESKQQTFLFAGWTRCFILTLVRRLLG